MVTKKIFIKLNHECQNVLCWFYFVFPCICRWSIAFLKTMVKRMIAIYYLKRNLLTEDIVVHSIPLSCIAKILQPIYHQKSICIIQRDFQLLKWIIKFNLFSILLMAWKFRLVNGQTSGVYAGLSIILDAQLYDYNVTSSDTVGFKVSIQGPDDFARTEKIGFLVNNFNITNLVVYRLLYNLNAKY